MKRSALVSIAALIAVAACQEMTTSPTGVGDISSLDARFSNPPPPPIDTGATGGIAATFAPQAAAIAAPSLPAAPGFERFAGGVQSLQSATNFTIPVTYLYNPVGNSGFLHFRSDNANDVEADANGMVRLQDGVFSGKGQVVIETFEGTLIIFLNSINSAQSSFEGCGDNFFAAALPDRPENGCFNVVFDEATLNGDPVGPVEFDPDCYPSEANQFCDVPEID